MSFKQDQIESLILKEVKKILWLEHNIQCAEISFHYREGQRLKIDILSSYIEGTEIVVTYPHGLLGSFSLQDPDSIEKVVKLIINNHKGIYEEE